MAIYDDPTEARYVDIRNSIDILDTDNEEFNLLVNETDSPYDAHPAIDSMSEASSIIPPVQVEKISWSSLPRKSQLAIMTLARLSEPLTQTSLQSYMYYQLKSFKDGHGSAPSDSTVARQAGLLAAAFTGAQFMTAMIWGRIADSSMGRKRVILTGLVGTAIGTLGFGFSDNFAAAFFWRFLGGMLNGNIGVMRTMISEIVKEKKFQSRAFLLLPMTFNIGVIIGPLLGGLLADPVGTYPTIFGPGGVLGGKEGVWLFTRWPYVLPNLVSAAFLLLGAACVALGLEETLDGVKDRPDVGIRISRWIRRLARGRESSHDYTAVRNGPTFQEHELGRIGETGQVSKQRAKLPFRRIWTPNVLSTLLAHGLLAMHVGTFNNLWFVFISTPRYNPDGGPAQEDQGPSSGATLKMPTNYHPQLPFKFTGGLALPPPSIGTALAILGFIGIVMQLVLYPRVNFRLGTIPSYRAALFLFPVAYILTPFLAIIPSTQPPPGQASGALVWVSITMVLFVQVLARTFALPATAILVNNCSPHPSVLGTVHGIGQSVSSGTRTIGPILASSIYAYGLDRGVVGAAWWGMAMLAAAGALAGQWVRDGDGHEIWLPEELEENEARRTAPLSRVPGNQSS